MSSHLSTQHYYYSHFTKENPEAQRNVTKVTEQSFKSTSLLSTTLQWGSPFKETGSSKRPWQNPAFLFIVFTTKHSALHVDDTQLSH